MILYCPSKEEARALVEDPRHFKTWTICDGALPPRFILTAGMEETRTRWLMPRLFCDETSARIVGAGGFKSQPSGGKIEIGYNVAPSCRRQGFATQAVCLLVQEAFASREVDRVIAHTAATNEASQRVLQKSGFAVCDSGNDEEGAFLVWCRQNPAG